MFWPDPIGGSVAWRGLLVSPLCLCACAPALSSFSPAHVAKPGDIQAEVGLDGSLPAGPIKQLADVAQELDNDSESQALGDAQRRSLTEGAWALLMNPPAVLSHLGVAVGVAKHTELQGRLTSGGWRLGGRYQLLHDDAHGIDFTTGLGVSRFKTNVSPLALLENVGFGDYVRWQFDVPMVFGQKGTWYRWWGGPRAVLVTYNIDLSVDLPPVEETPGSSMGADITGYGLYLGGQLGAAIGYKYVFVAAELTVTQFIGRGTIRTSGIDALGTYKVRGSGPIVYPGVALMAEF